MNIAVLINDFQSLKPSQTTAAFIHQLAATQERVSVFGVADLSASTDGEGTYALAATADPRAASVSDQVAALRVSKRESTPLCAMETVLVRTNPARDRRPFLHQAALVLLEQLGETGVRVVNSPRGLMATGSKLFLTELPAWTLPETLITGSKDDIVAFVETSTSATVLKPASGTRGDDVFMVEPGSANLQAIIASILRQGYVVCQEFVPESAAGDTRVLVLDGRIIEIDGAPAAVRRVPARGEFRSNVHVGGRPEAGQITAGMRRVVEGIGGVLRRHGLRFVGIDFLGDLICEVNVFSPGGLQDAARYYERDFLSVTLDALISPADWPDLPLK